MKSFFLRTAAILLLFTACKKSDDNSNTTPTPTTTNNKLRIVRASGSDTSVPYGNIICGAETSTTGSMGTFWSVRAFVNAGGPSYDRLAVAWKTEPAAGEYPLISMADYGALPTGSAAANLTYGGYNNGIVAGSGTVKVEVVGGKKRISFTNLLYSSGSVPPAPVPPMFLPDSTKLSTTITCP